MLSQEIILMQIGVIFLLIGAGYLLSRKKLIDENIVTGLTNILLSLALPALVISSCISSSGFNDIFRNVVMIFFASLGLHALLIILSKVFFAKYTHSRRKTLTYLAIFPNVGFMGMPLVLALYGEAKVVYGVAFLMGYQLVIWTYGVFLFQEKKPFQDAIFEIAKMPLFQSVVLGMLILFFSAPVPKLLTSSLSMLGAMTAPLAMIVIGHQMTQMKLLDLVNDKDVYVGSFVRLIIAPIVTWLVLQSLNLDPVIINICVLLQVLPSATTITLMPQKYGGDVVFSTKCLIATHGLSFFTMPIMLTLLKA